MIERLSARLERIEKLLQLQDEPAAPPTKPEPPSLEVHAPAPEDVALPTAAPSPAPPAPTPPPPPAPPAPPPPPPTPPVAPPTAPPTRPAVVRQGTAPPRPSMEAQLTEGQAPTTPAPAMTPPAAPPFAPRKPKKGRGPLELRIGRSWAAWGGAFVVVVAMGFLAKLAIDEGWWGSLPVLVRFLLIAAFGGGLVACGELALRRIGVAASVGLFGAGLGTLYLDAFAAFQWFESAAGVPLVSREWSFVLMGVVALLGFGITLRTNFLTIGVLSIIGGYLTPWLLRGGATHVIEVGTFLTMLLGVALALSAVKPDPFRPLRYVALVAHGLLGVGWVWGASTVMWVAPLVFIVIWWGLVQAEIVFAAMRRQSTYGNVLASLLASAWLVTVGCWLLTETLPTGQYDWTGPFALGVGATAGVLALQFGPPLGDLGRPGTAMAKLAVALWAQAAVLLAVAIALQFDGFGQSIGWLAVALASIEIGRRLRYRAVDIFGFIVGALALVRVVIADSGLAALRPELFAFGGVSVTKWAVLALAAIAVLHAGAQRLRDKWVVAPVVLAVMGMLFWLGLCVEQCSGLWTTGAWLLGGTVLVATERFGRRQRYLEIGLLVLVATAARWAVMDVAVRRADPGWDPAASLPFLNWQMGLAVATAAVGWWAARLLARRPRAETTPMHGTMLSSAVWQLALLAAAGLVLLGLSFELDHAVEAMIVAGRDFVSPVHLLWLLLTMLWSLGSVGLGVMARVLFSRGPQDPLTGQRGPNLLVGFAWGLLAFTAVKWLIGDTLFWAWADRVNLLSDVSPVVNLQMLAGIVVAASGVVLLSLTKPPAEQGAKARPSVHAVLAGCVPVAVSVLVLWALSFEIDRAVGRYFAGPPDGIGTEWGPNQTRALWWTFLWGAGGLAMMFWSRFRPAQAMATAGWFIVVLATMAWLGADTVGFRVATGPVLAPVVFNLQFLVGAALLAILGASFWHWSRSGADVGGVSAATAARVSLVLVGITGLWLGTLELDRFFAPEAQRLAANAAMARQTAFSIYWGLYAIGTVTAGFIWRSALVRYAGLGLLAITLGKVLLVDMHEVDKVYRVLSFLGVGLLLVATSVGYAKLAPRLAGEGDDGSADTVG
jgi:uncharacterized membrane protein